MKNRLVHAVTAAFGISMLVLGSPAWADRATQVNDRLGDQSGRVQSGGKHHKMSQGEQMRRDEADYRIENEEQNMRNRHKGKLTRFDQRRLNRQLNRNGRRIHGDKNN